MSMQTALWLAMLAGVVAIVYGVFMSRWILAQPRGQCADAGNRRRDPGRAPRPT